MNNLLQRTLSGAIFVALVAGSILWCPYAFGGVFVLAAALAVREFHRLSNRQDQEVNVPPAVGMAGAALLFACSYLYASGTLPGIIYAAYGVYVAAVMVAELYRKQAHPIHNWAYFLLGQVMVALPFALLNFILFVPGYRPLILLAVFVTIWVNDTGAYCAGSLLGRHKLFPRVSPGKTWEGSVGGGVFVLITAAVIGHLANQGDTPHLLGIPQWMGLGLVVTVFGTWGDLVESLLKRTWGIKDSGKLLPGHGGMLDRFDSSLLAIPAAVIYLYTLNFFL